MPPGNFANLGSTRVSVRHFGAAKWSKTFGLMSLHNTRWENAKKLYNARRKCNTSQKILKVSSFPLFSEFYDKSEEFDKDRENARQQIKTGDSISIKSEGLESLKMSHAFMYMCYSTTQINATTSKLSFLENISGTLSAFLSIRGETKKKRQSIQNVSLYVTRSTG